MNPETGSRSQRLSRQIVMATLAIIVCGAYPMSLIDDMIIVRSVIIALLLSVIHAVLGYAALRFSDGKQFDQFIQIVLGGIGVRLIVMIALLLISVLAFELRIVVFMSALFGFYLVFLVMEIVHIHHAWNNTLSLRKDIT